jgi:glycosyltransferase involved in cell wall biosynthesis
MNRRLDRVALFWTGLWGGGAERVMLTIAQEFSRRGITVDIVLTTTEGELKSEIPPQARVFDLKASRIATSLPGLANYLRNEEPPVLLTALKSANCVAIWARMIANVSTKLVISEHSTLSLANQHSEKLTDRLFPKLMRYTYPRADGIIAVSKGTADDLASVLQLPREDIEVVYNPAVTPQLLEMAKEQVEHPWFRRENFPVVIGVGRLNEAKDFPTLLRAFKRVRQSHPARLVILGEGEKRTDLEELATDLDIDEWLWMPGFVSNPFKFMANSSVFALSSKWEGLGNVLIEAMACGIPVVATDCENGPSEILDEGRYGKLFLLAIPMP